MTPQADHSGRIGHGICDGCGNKGELTAFDVPGVAVGICLCDACCNADPKLSFSAPASVWRLVADSWYGAPITTGETLKAAEKLMGDIDEQCSAASSEEQSR